MDKEIRNLLLIAGLGFGALYFLKRTVTAIPRALTSLGEAIGSGLYDLLHPNQVGEMLFYTVIFPDGQQHSVASKSVTKEGQFTREGITYQLLVDKGQQTGVNKYAVKV